MQHMRYAGTGRDGLTLQFGVVRRKRDLPCADPQQGEACNEMLHFVGNGNPNHDARSDSGGRQPGSSLFNPAQHVCPAERDPLGDHCLAGTAPDVVSKPRSIAHRRDPDS